MNLLLKEKFDLMPTITESNYLAYTNNQSLIKAQKKLLNKKSPGTAGQQIKGAYDLHGIYGKMHPRGVQEKAMNIDFNILRRIAGGVAPIMAIHQNICSNIKPFRKFSRDPDELGFMVKLKDVDKTPNKKEKEEIKEIETFFRYSGLKETFYQTQKGFYTRKDMLGDINERIVRDLLTIDQIAIVPLKNLAGRLIEFRVIDGSTIQHVDPEVGFDNDKDIKYVQMVQGDIREVFVEGEIIFDFMNKRSDIDKWLYGYAPLEMMIETITAFLNATAYNKEFFNSATQPKGFISFKGDNFDEEELEEVRKRFNSMFGGIKGLWRIPFFQGDADFKPMFMNNRDMEYDKYMQLLLSWICAIYKVDPAELGWKLQYQGNVTFDNVDAKQQFSKSRIIVDIVSFLETLYNKLLMLDSVWSEKYEIVATGIKPKDKKYEADLDQTKVKTYMTVNEIRKGYDLEPLPDGDIILDSVYQQAKQMSDMEAQQGSDEDYGYDEVGDNEDFNNEEISNIADEVVDDIFKSKSFWDIVV